MFANTTLQAGLTSPSPLAIALVVSGTTSPDCTGNYYPNGIFGNAMTYVRSDGAWFLWYYAISHHWIISSIRGTTGTYSWNNTVLIGSYSPNPGGASGIVTIGST